MYSTRNSLSNLISVHEDQISNLKSLLSQSLSVKLKYENIIKKLLENEEVKGVVLQVIELMQQTRSTTALSNSSLSNL